eukprot:jgi/Ulvmu1/12033/UM083_0046.1
MLVAALLRSFLRARQCCLVKRSPQTACRRLSSLRLRHVSMCPMPHHVLARARQQRAHAAPCKLLPSATCSVVHREMRLWLRSAVYTGRPCGVLATVCRCSCRRKPQSRARHGVTVAGVGLATGMGVARIGRFQWALAGACDFGSAEAGSVLQRSA